LEAILASAPSRFQDRNPVRELGKASKRPLFSPDGPKLKGKRCESERPISRRGDRACLRLTHLLVVPIEDYREQRGGQNIEDNDIDVRMSFDQGEH
jgi:hypothetical protein